MTNRDDRLVEVRFEVGWIPGINEMCKAKMEDCGFQQFFNKDRSTEVSTYLYWNEVKSLHRQLTAILEGVPINTNEWPIDDGQPSLEDFEE